jgi:hypothetical protein
VLAKLVQTLFVSVNEDSDVSEFVLGLHARGSHLIEANPDQSGMEQDHSSHGKNFLRT